MSYLNILLCIGCLAAGLAAQSSNAAEEVEITSEPHHHLTFQNQDVRVFNVEVEPGAQTMMHWHHHDYIAVTLSEAEVSNSVKDKPTVALKLAEGDTRFAAGNFVHFVKDVGPQAFRNVTIELLQDETLRASEAAGRIKWDEERGLDVLEGGTRDILFVKDGVRASEFELQPGGVAPEFHRAGPILLVAISDLQLHKNGAASVFSQMKSGDHIWVGADESFGMTNTGPKTAKFVTLEFP